MVGTTFKLGFDASAVKSGLGKLGGMMGRGLKQVGIGATREVGVKMTDFLGRMVSLVPEATSEFITWSGSMVDLSEATGIATKDLMLLTQAMTEAGFEGDPTASLVTFANNIYDAKNGSEELIQTFQKLGFTYDDLFSKSKIQLLEQLGKATAGMEQGERTGYLRTLLGGRFGKKGVAVFQDLNKAMAETKKSIGGMTDQLNPLLADVDTFGDMLSRFAYLRRSLISGVFQGAGINNMKDMADSLLTLGQKLQPLAYSIGQMFEPMLKFLEDAIKKINEMGFGKWIEESTAGIWKSIGAAIGVGIKESFGFGGGGAGGGGIGNGIKNMLNPFKSKEGKMDIKMLDATTAQTDILERIYNKNPIALFA